MRPDFKVAIILFLAAIPCAACIAVAPEYLHLKGHGLTATYWGGMVLTAILLILAIAVAFRAEAQTPPKGHGRRMIGIIGMGICGFGFLAFATIFFIQRPIEDEPSLKAGVDVRKETFLVSLAGGITGMQGTPLVAAHRSAFLKGPQYIGLPVMALYNFNITNKQQHPVTPIGYELEIAEENEGPWIRLCRIDLQKNEIYGMPDKVGISKWMHFQIPNRLDNLMRQSIPAHGVVSGWAAWFCPAGTKCIMKFARLVLREAIEEPEYYPVRHAGGDLTDKMVGFDLSAYPEDVDLKQVQITHPVDCIVPPVP